ncbi:hypothetical protein TNCV_2028061 [Trichonephila clavipes]|nr:hypothetical protein TNCV_2028061 [Trichonephila clavipes]
MTSLLSRSDSSRLLAVGISKFQGVLNLTIKSVGVSRSDPLRALMYTDGHSALCHSWIPNTLGMCHPLWWWICATHAAVINDLVT